MGHRRTGRRTGAPGSESNGAETRADAGTVAAALAETVDHAAFPDRAARLAVDGGAASARFRALLAEGGPILADGAMGTMLFANGLQFGDPPELWNLEHPDIVRRIQRAYLEAGSRILLTNTFGGNRLRLGLHGLQDRVDELNRTAAILLRAEVDAAGGTALVAGDIGPTGEIVAPLGTLDYDEAVEVFREQAASLVAGGVDLIWIETMSDLNEIRAAIQGVRRASPGIALVATMTFDTRGHTMMGVSPEDAVLHLAAWGADAVGGNCGNGPDELIPVIAKMHAVAPDVVLVAKSNAGMPELVDMQAVYRASPESMAGTALELRDAGARIVGACCGSSPDHLRAMAGALTPIPAG
ncbi:MAG TPA: homocysteine S-methyltransferase family protein [Candidatus Limnocylindrales bacterium]